MIRPARSRRSTSKSTFRPSSRIYFRPRRAAVGGNNPNRSVSAGVATVGLTAQTSQVKISVQSGGGSSNIATFGMSAQNATVKIKVSAGVALIDMMARNAIPVQNIACAWFEAAITVDQHFCTVDLDSVEAAITLDAHEGVVGVEENYGEVVVCGRP